MKKRNFLIFILLTNFVYALEINESFRIDGYANIEGKTTTQENIDTFGMSTGIQGRYQVSENISITGHIYFEEDNSSNSLNDYNEDIKWLYADYYLGNEITLRAGKFQFPTFTSSETGTIGYSRTWTENPISSYGAFGYDNFIGAEILKNFSYDNYNFLLQLSYGKSENELPTLNNNSSLKGEADSIGGITLKTSNDWLMLNISCIRALSTIDDPQTNLEPNVNFNMYAFETQADLDDFSFKAGFVRADLSSIFPDEQRYYTSLEYNYNDLTPYIYYANEELDFKNQEHKKSENYSLGLRYDIYKNIAIKFSYINSIDTLKYNNSESTNKEDVLKTVINVIF